MARQRKHTEVLGVWHAVDREGNEGLRRLAEGVEQEVWEAEITQFPQAEAYERTPQGKSFPNGLPWNAAGWVRAEPAPDTYPPGRDEVETIRPLQPRRLPPQGFPLPTLVQPRPTQVPQRTPHPVGNRAATRSPFPSRPLLASRIFLEYRLNPRGGYDLFRFPG